MTPADHYRMFANYNSWANNRLYEAAARLSSEQYRADRGAFFKSVHGTLNHLLVTDRIWMQRFTGEGDAPNWLDAILFETLDELRAAREAEDRRIVRFVEGAGRPSHRRHHQIPSRLLARRIRAATGAGAGALVQSPDPPPRASPCVADRPPRSGAGTRSVVFPAADGEAGRMISRKLHRVLCRLGGLRVLRRRGECSKTVQSGGTNQPWNPVIY